MLVGHDHDRVTDGSNGWRLDAEKDRVAESTETLSTGRSARWTHVRPDHPTDNLCESCPDRDLRATVLVDDRDDVRDPAHSYSGYLDAVDDAGAGPNLSLGPPRLRPFRAVRPRQ